MEGLAVSDNEHMNCWEKLRSSNYKVEKNSDLGMNLIDLATFDEKVLFKMEGLAIKAISDNEHMNCWERLHSSNYNMNCWERLSSSYKVEKNSDLGINLIDLATFDEKVLFKMEGLAIKAISDNKRMNCWEKLHSSNYKVEKNSDLGETEGDDDSRIARSAETSSNESGDDNTKEDSRSSEDNTSESSEEDNHPAATQSRERRDVN